MTVGVTEVSNGQADDNCDDRPVDALTSDKSLPGYTLMMDFDEVVTELLDQEPQQQNVASNVGSTTACTSTCDPDDGASECSLSLSVDSWESSLRSSRQNDNAVIAQLRERCLLLETEGRVLRKQLSAYKMRTELLPSTTEQAEEAQERPELQAHEGCKHRSRSPWKPCNADRF